MKKKEKKSVMALAGHQVTQSVNLNISQNDVIDIAIQESLDVVEKEIEHLGVQIKANAEVYKQLRTDLATKFLLMKLEANKEFTNFKKIMSVAGREFREDLIEPIIENKYLGGHMNEDDIKLHVVGTFKSVNWDRVEGYKNPVTYAKQQTVETNCIVNGTTGVTYRIVSEKNGFVLSFTDKFEVPVALNAKWMQQLRPLVEEELKLKNKLYDANLRRLELTYGEKKVKAQFMKTALANSEQGRAVLQLLEQATNVKLIG